jgi:D-sedoheptulose 7-phosphate isomerase
MHSKKIDDLFEESIQTIIKSKKLKNEIISSIDIIYECLKNEGKIIAFGNGGSAADSQHFVAEFIGRFQKERKSIPAISFTTDTSIITAIGNDYSFDKIFERQAESLVAKNDVVIAISTSGRSKNVLRGIKMAKKKGAKIIILSSNSGKELSKNSDVSILIPSKSTPRIQEVHRIVLHYICELVENKIVE